MPEAIEPVGDISYSLNASHPNTPVRMECLGCTWADPDLLGTILDQKLR